MTNDEQAKTPTMRELMDIVGEYVDQGYHLISESKDESGKITLILGRGENA